MEFSFDNFAKEGLHEECGVFGIFSDGTINPAYACYNGLLALQHRGQESCGIAVSDEGVIDYHKDMGLVTEVFNNKILDSLNGQMAVSHVRYSTAGGSVLENAQPLVMRYVKGTLSIAHNGNLTNALEIRRGLEQRGAIFQTTIDSEVICYVIARERLKCHSVEDAVARTMQVIEGAYSLLVMSPRKLIAVRDPHGFRPLCMGKYNDSYVFASESAALDACGAEFVRDVEPGAVIPPSVPVAPHQRVDQKPVGGPREVFRVFADCLEDQRHLIVLVAVADVLVAVGVRLIVGDGDTVGRRVELPPPLHVGPHAADEVGGGAVAQNVIFLHPLRHRGLEDVQQRGGEGHALRRAFRDDGGHGFRIGEGAGLQVGVHKGVDVGEVVGVQLVAELAGVFLLKGLELAVDGQHFLKLLRFQKTQRLVPELIHGRGFLRHGKALL